MLMTPLNMSSKFCLEKGHQQRLGKQVVRPGCNGVNTTCKLFSYKLGICFGSLQSISGPEHVISCDFHKRSSNGGGGVHVQ